MIQHSKKKSSKIFKNELALMTAKIEETLERLLQECKGDEELLRAMKYMLIGGGKRLRPILFLKAFSIFNLVDNRALEFAAAIEILHTYTLVHDDLPCMDDDNFRRGKPTCHKAFSEHLAVLCGDALLNLAHEIILKHCGDSNFLKAAQFVSSLTGAGALISGQVKDMRCQAENLEELLKIFEQKTGSLILAAVYSGALCAGANSNQLQSINDFGKNFGLAFQIYDDIDEYINDGKINEPASITAFLSVEESIKILQESIEKAKQSLDGLTLQAEKIESQGVLFLQELVTLFAQNANC